MRNVMKIFSGFAIALLLGASAVHAQGADGQSAAVPQVSRIAVDESMSLIVDEGQALRISAPVTSIFVSNPEVADVQVKSSQLLYVFGKRVGRTSFYAVDAQDNVIISRQLVVGLNLSGLRNAISQITGSNRVHASVVEDMIMLTGSVDDASTAQDIVKVATRYLPAAVVASGGGSDQVEIGRNYIINRMAIVGSNQVNLRVRIAEVSREAIKTLGVTSSVGTNTGVIGFSFDAGVSAAENNAVGFAQTAIGATPIGAALEALVTDGLATILAEPNLTALSGETASFLAGGEFPIPIVSNDQVTVEFREFGVRLSFTPTVVNGDRISMRVRPEVSERDDSRAVNFGNGEIPGMRTRRAETSVELGSGQSFAIAGLIQSDTTQNVQKYPGLADIPILGALFRSDRFRQNQSELVIVVTPYLVKPVSANQVALPTDGFVPPNDIDRWLNGRMNSERPTPARVPVARQGNSTAEGGLVGEVGYVLQ